MLDEHTQLWLREYLTVSRECTAQPDNSAVFATKCQNAINAIEHAITTQRMVDFLHAERTYVQMLSHMEPDELSDIEQ